MLKAYDSIVFFVLFLSLCLLYGYADELNEPANGIHVWRQTDGLSLALSYYEEGNNLFQPRMHNQLSKEGQAVGEFPVLYYFIGKLYWVFGEQFWVYRGLWWLLVFTGHFYLFKFCRDILNSSFWGVSISLFAFTSPIVIIYGFSFICDPIALSLIYVSWYTLLKYSKNKELKWLLSSVILICIATLLKITSLVSIIAVALVFLISTGLKVFRKQVSIYILIPELLALSAIALTTISWYTFANWYNQQNLTEYFFLKFAPVWEFSEESVMATAKALKGWLRVYFYETGRHVLYAFAFLTLIPFSKKHLSKYYYWLMLLSWLGMLSFLFLFFSQFTAHDYYFVSLTFIVPATVVFFIKSFHWLLNKNNSIKLGFRLAFSVLLIASVVHATKRSNERFANTSEWLDEDLFELRTKIDSFGISKSDFILFPHDPSPNISLYAINMKGWTALNGIRDPKVFQSKVEAGAKWMFISDSRFYNNSIIDPYKNRFITDFKGIRIYCVKKDCKQLHHKYLE